MRKADIDFGRVAIAFAADGIHGVSMDEVARVAGVAKPTLYRHFRNKDDLFVATVRYECDRLLQTLFTAYGAVLDRPIPERLEAGARALFDYRDVSPAGFRLLFDTGVHESSEVAATVEATMRRISDRVAAMLRRELERFGSPHGRVADALAEAIIGMIVAVARRASHEPDWPPDALVSLLGALQTAIFFGITRDVLKRVDTP